ncbi:MAG: hypothetical protein JNL11_02130 [Bdellovibrionaceae bacterium]|nr:hypothetical protein [Pseudobdellovibrionaceae bacterium]
MKSIKTKITAVLATLLFVLTGKAKIGYPVSVNKVEVIVNELVKRYENNGIELYQVLNAKKVDLEKAFRVTLTNQEYESIMSSIAKLLNYGFDIRVVPVDVMVLSTQEWLGGGHNK